MKNIEIEFKVMVSEKNFQYLLFKMKEKNKNDDFFIQENVYFDTIHFALKKNHLSLRIRYIQNKNEYILTLKEKLTEGKLEHEFMVTDLNIQSCADEIQYILNQYHVSINDLIEIARLTTKRTQFKFSNDTIICFDENFYYDQKDYEIECESTSMLKAQNVLTLLCKQYQIPYQISKESKSLRAIKNKK